MFDTLPTTEPKADTPWAETLRSGDLVSFRFPVHEREAGPNPKTRPCLVIATATFSGQRWITLAYGTSKMEKARKGYAIPVNARDAIAAGLDSATAFKGDRVVIVRPNHPGFVVSKTFLTPVLGRLTGRPLDRMRAVQARLQAEADMAAERRAERRRGRIDARKAMIKNKARAAARAVITGA